MRDIQGVLNHIGSDMLEPLGYLPWGLLAGLIFLTGETIRHRCLGKCEKIPSVAKKHRWISFLCIVYVTVLLILTYFSREPGSRIGVTIEIFHTWGKSPLEHAFFIENILLFIPFGILFPFAFRPLRNPFLCILEGFLLSVFLELMQFISGRGYCQLDDVVTNTLGAGIGWGIYRFIALKRRPH